MCNVVKNQIMLNKGSFETEAERKQAASTQKPDIVWST